MASPTEEQILVGSYDCETLLLPYLSQSRKLNSRAQTLQAYGQPLPRLYDKSNLKKKKVVLYGRNLFLRNLYIFICD